MKTVELIKNRIKNSRCAVLGFGVSNVPLVELLIECGNEITVHDKKDIEKLGEKAKLFSKQGVRFVTGENYLADSSIALDQCRALGFSGIHIVSDKVFDLMEEYVKEMV